MRELDWTQIDACLTCFALVPTQMKAEHESWHDRIAAEAIRSARRLDQIEGTLRLITEILTARPYSWPAAR